MKNEELLDKWIDALRSGDYKQGKRKLKNVDQYGQYFCCLGVLKELEPSCGSFANESLEKTPFRGLSEGGYIKIEDGDSINLADLNDTGKTFAEIADVIEKHREQILKG